MPWVIVNWNKSKGKYDRVRDKENNLTPVFKYPSQAVNYLERVLKTKKYDVKKIGEIK